MTAAFIVRLRDQDVEVRGTFAPAEPDVGIMSAYLEDYDLFDESGDQLDWDLTEEECQKIDKAAMEYYYDSDDDYEPEEYPEDY